MASYCGQSELIDYFNFSTSPQAPIKVAVCPFVQGGSGMPLAMFSMFFFGAVGLALANRIQHPAPLVVAAMLTAGVAALSIPGNAGSILALVLFFAIAGLGVWLYSRANSSL